MRTKEAEKHSIRLFGSQAGSGLLSAILGIGMIGIIAMTASRISTHVLSAQARMKADSEVEFLQRLIFTTTSCTKTAYFGGVGAGSWVRLLRANGTQLIPGNRTGMWAVRARVQSNAIHVEYSGLRRIANLYATNPADADFRKDPLTGKPMSWRPLMPKGMPLCKGLANTKRMAVTMQSIAYVWDRDWGGTFPERKAYHAGGCLGMANNAYAIFTMQRACHRLCRQEAAHNFEAGTYAECDFSTNTVICMCTR